MTFEVFYSETHHRRKGARRITINGTTRTALATHFGDEGERGAQANKLRTRHGDIVYVGTAVDYGTARGRGDND